MRQESVQQFKKCQVSIYKYHHAARVRVVYERYSSLLWVMYDRLRLTFVAKFALITKYRL